MILTVSFTAGLLVGAFVTTVVWLYMRWTGFS